MKGEFKKRWVLISSVMMGVLLFSLTIRAQDTVQYRTNTTTYESRTDTYDSDQRVRRDRDYDQARARVGIKGGLNISNLMKGGEVTDNNLRLGYHVGLFGQLFPSEAFTIQPEVNFSTKGNEVTTRFDVIDQETKFNLSYIDIPVLAVFKLGPAAEIHAGAYWAYLVGANIDTDGDLGDGFQNLDRKNFENWDYGLVGGIGFNLGPAVQLGARYNYGLKEIARSAGARRMIGNAKNSVGQIYLAFNLNSGASGY